MLSRSVVPVYKFSARTASTLLCTALLVTTAALVTSCGSSSAAHTTADAPPQPNYPSAPPVPITWSPETSKLPAPPAEVPPPAASNDFPLLVASPLDKASVGSPLTVTASANPKNPIFFMRVYVDQLAVYFTFGNTINAQIFVATGQHTIEVMAEDRKGYISATPLHVTVSSQPQQTTITGIQALPGWLDCGKNFPPGSGRDGQVCASGGGDPTSQMTQNVSSPSMDGNSAEFSISPALPACPGYCNQLYWNPVAGGNNVSHFTYDLYFTVDDPTAPQALEFDLNQTYGGQRWVWGSECNFKGDGVWDIWDDASGLWRPTTIPCLATQFPANQWNHIIWDVQQAGSNVQYNTLTVNGTTYPVNTTYANQQQWTLEEIDAAFQVDMDQLGHPYHAWLDKVNLTAQ
jgi:hypothetical protein